MTDDSPQPASTADRLSTDAKWILGAIGGAVVLALGLYFDIRTEFRDVRNEIRAARTEVLAAVGALDTRVRAVEVALGKVDQRLLTIERIILPAPE